MTFFLDDTTRDDLATSAPPEPSFADRFKAASAMQRIEDDSWSRKAGFEDALADELIGQLPEDLRTRMTRPFDRYEMPRHRRAELFDVLAEARERDPSLALPGTVEEFDAIVSTRRRAEYDEQVAILSAAPEGSWGAEFLGRSWAGLTEEKSLVSLVLGAPARVGILGTMAIEGALGGATEATMIDQRQLVADELGTPDPNPVLDIAVATGAAGLFVGGIKGIVVGARRFGEYRAARGRGAEAARPDGTSPMQHEGQVEAARERLENDQEAAGKTAARGPAMSDFDFSRAGNASPETNRVGYIFGKLLERGYEPHIAAGIVGNGMVESGVILSPRAVGDGGAAYGIFQWNGPRKRALMDFAAARGKSADDIDTQLDFLEHELNGAEAGAWARIRQAKTADEAAVLFSRHFERPGTPHLSRRVGHARDVMAQFEAGGVPRWTGKATPVNEGAPVYTTSRGYTGDGQVVAGDRRIDVSYEVVDASLLRRASGDLQPRDRSRAASDEQIAEIAARLDAARLMPAPEADRGAPLVGPDLIIESGNGRVAAIERAYERHPDRAAAYRAQIEAAGFAVPEGVERPVLIARRTSELTPAERRAVVRDANMSTTARMSSTERAAAEAPAMDPALAFYRADTPLRGEGNAEFHRAALARLPQAERAALVDEKGGLNAEGARRLQDALFARAWPSADVIARFTEGDAGELRSLVDALSDAAPAWAAMRAAVARGELRPEFDITDHVLDAMRLIGAARELATRENKTVAGMVEELLDEVDLLDGAISPLTAALVRKFWQGGRAAPKDQVARFLTRYAAEAQRIGTPEAGLLDAPGPADALRAIDRETFGELPDELGAPRPRPEPVAIPDDAPDRYAGGASSPEAEAEDAAAMESLRTDGPGPFGPIHNEIANDPEAAIALLLKTRDGEVPNAFDHPGLGKIAFVYGRADRVNAQGKTESGFGIAHIEADKDQGMLSRLPDILRKGTVYDDPDGFPKKYIVDDGDPAHFAVVRLKWDNLKKRWIVTVVRDDREKFKARDRWEAYRTDFTEERVPSSNEPTKDSASAPSDQEPDLAAEIAAARADHAEMADLTFRLSADKDAPAYTLREFLDDIEDDHGLAEVLNLCNPGGRT